MGLRSCPRTKAAKVIRIHFRPDGLGIDWGQRRFQYTITSQGVSLALATASTDPEPVQRIPIAYRSGMPKRVLVRKAASKERVSPPEA